MTKEKYMALADFQTLWDDKLKPWINDDFATKQDTYTKEEVDNMALASMFRLYVDPADMHLKGRNPADGTFEVVNGHLIMHQTT